MLADKLTQLLAQLQTYDRLIVAMSAGVDSTVLAKAAQVALGDRALAVTGSSASLAEGELAEATRLAALIGIRHEVVATEEFASDDYRRNSPDRCFHCKTELYSQLVQLANRFEGATIANGANLDDQGDYRPGMQAAADHRVCSPLLDCGFTKADVRALAAHWELPVWDKPASPCLSSRVAYGEEVTPERVAMIDRAEQHLRSLGLREVRVRYHRGDLARVEVPVEAIAKLADTEVREALVRELTSLGFKYITLDLAGFRSGSLNAVLPLSAIKMPRAIVT